MHSYLRCIGFSDVKKKTTVDAIIENVIAHCDEKLVTQTPDHRMPGQLYCSYGEDMGISVVGEYDELNRFHMEYYFPYYLGSGISSRAALGAEKHGGRESFAGALEDERAGGTLFFYLQNVVEFQKRTHQGYTPDKAAGVTLSALSDEGKILLPAYEKEHVMAEVAPGSINRNDLMRAARKGDAHAMEQLAMDDIKLYASLTKRISQEDILSIVDSFVIPCGIECDQYHLLGTITDVREAINTLTEEPVVQMSVLANDIQLDVCINKKDLFGTPMVGCRFKGYVWMQGMIDY